MPKKEISKTKAEEYKYLEDIEKALKEEQEKEPEQVDPLIASQLTLADVRCEIYKLEDELKSLKEQEKAHYLLLKQLEEAQEQSPLSY